MNGHVNGSAESVLPPPTFSLPADFDDDRYELWTVRLPASAEAADLDGLKLDLKNPASQHFESQGSKYTFQLGHAVENESFRLLLPNKPYNKAAAAANTDSSDEGDSSQDSDEDLKYVYPTHLPFQRHLNIVTAVPVLHETELAPRIDNAPIVTVPLRRAYQPVAQKTGLKRRWMPMGASTVEQSTSANSVVVEVTAPPVVTVNGKHAKSSTSTENRVKVESPTSIHDPSATKSEKKAKKEAKKQKKEHKKAKKEAKKLKKEH